MKSNVLLDYKLVFWDFDGVLMDSMSIRDRGFSEVLSDYPEDQVQQLLAYHRANGGLSRYVKFRYFFEEIRNEQITEEEVAAWASKFSQVMRDLLVHPNLLINETIACAKDLHEQAGIKQFIVSGPDQKELRSLTAEQGVAGYFEGIYGSPVPNKKLLASNRTVEPVKREKACRVRT